MASRKQKIKSKREQEQAEIRQVRIAVGIFAAVIVIGIAAFFINDSGILKAPFDYPGTPEEICEHETPADGGGQNGQYSSAPEMSLEDMSITGRFSAHRKALSISTSLKMMHRKRSIIWSSWRMKASITTRSFIVS